MKLAFFITAFLIWTATTAFGKDESGNTLLKLNGSKVSLFWVADQSEKKVVYALLGGNNSTNLNLTLDAPKGTKVTTAISALSGTIAQTLARASGFNTLQTITREKALELNSGPCISFSPGEGSAENNELPPLDLLSSDSPLCNLFSAPDRAAIGVAISTLYGVSLSEGQVCGYLVSNYLGGAEPCDQTDPICALLEALQKIPQSIAFQKRAANEFKQYSVRLTKDACAARSTNYLLKIIIQIPKNSIPAKVSISGIESEFTGDRAASIKPLSDGRFAPQPLLLMSFLGNVCGQRIEIVKWSKGIKRSSSIVMAQDLIPYRGRVLTRTPIGRFMSGGKATFELFNGLTNYSVCFTLTKKRQKVNGY